MKIITKLTRIFSVIIILSLVSSFTGFSQAPAWVWGKNGSGAGDEQGYVIATDVSGNVYVAGSFAGPSITLGTFTLNNPSPGYYDVFVAKYNNSGTVMWAKTFTGTDNNAEAYGLALDGSGNVYITGYFESSSLTIGSLGLVNTGGTAGWGDVFLVKYNSSGTEQWAKKAGTADDDEFAYSLGVDASGNIYVAGLFNGPSVTFGSTTLTNVNTGYNDFFLTKYDNSGNVLWAKSGSGDGNEAPHTVKVDGSGNVLMVGFFDGTSVTLGSTVLSNSSAGTYDVFAAKYNSSGVVQWAKKAGGADDDLGAGATIDASGNCYIIGGYNSSSITFGVTTLTNTSASGTTSDMFYVKYDAAGTLQWAKNLGGTGDELGYGITTDAAGYSYVSGVFTSASVTAGPNTLTNTMTGYGDVLVLKYNSAGSIVWGKSTGGADEDHGNYITADASGNLYVLGFYYSSSIAFGSSTLTNAGGQDMFLAKLASTVGIDEHGMKIGSLMLYPNPASFAFFVQVPFEIKGKGILTIYNMLGAEVIKRSVSGMETEKVDASMLAKGVYTVELVGSDKIYRATLVKE